MRSLRIEDNGRIVSYIVPEEIVGLCAGMSVNWNDYIDADRRVTLVAVDALIWSRARPDGLAGAVKRMQEASAGLRPKRKPIEVRKQRDGFLICDGNSTAIAMAAIGIEGIPVVLLGGSDSEQR